MPRNDIEPHHFEPLDGPLTRAIHRVAVCGSITNDAFDQCLRCFRPKHMHPVREWTPARPVRE